MYASLVSLANAYCWILGGIQIAFVVGLLVTSVRSR